ncbi:putative disease resistance protein RGA1 [Chenopodium quinoa]|uniref:putative disease resistance protein RGA1 n=1 Tax=Chenopodium quinoa TaxID=63459 RepID=UPI000B76FE90|nr:putative disease resistance protein RGA1 [Chenopodium quinoa]
MDIGTAMSVAQTLFAALQCSQLNEICSIAGYKSKLDELRATVVRIKAVLKDAEAKQVLSEQEQLYIEELKDAVYEADDLFDEFVTLAQRKQLTKGIKVRVLSLFTKFGTAYNMAQGVKRIKNKLDAIAYDKRFSLTIDPKPIKNRRLETCSYVYEADIIGREPDLEKIVGVLLDSNVQQDELLGVQGVLDNILASATGNKMNEGCTMDWLQRKLREQLAGKKYLLVLDDVWTENFERWHTLKQYLMEGRKGSWVVVTTRSHVTAQILGDGLRHELKGLSKEDSLCLFKRVAFGSQHSNPPEDLVNIGEGIVEECANVPLAIRVVGSLLYGQEKNKWLSIQKLGLAEVKESQVSIMPILKLSYYKLESTLKSCFSYCAIFPKDYVMEKDTLIRLWMAQGYIPFNDPQSPEDLAEEYFSILLRRCFFQDVSKDEDGNIMSCKVHDLMHDVAQEVVGKEICTVKAMNGNMDKKVRHLIVQGKSLNYLSNKTHIRSFIQTKFLNGFFSMDHLCVDLLVANWKCLRALDLSRSRIKSLPGSIGDLIHLRYLDLYCNSGLEFILGSITKLYNLQTLDFRSCINLKELPKGLGKMVKLRVLALQDCNKLRYMPRGIGMLTCLHTLNEFVVGGTSKKEVFDGLEDLKALRNLRGSLRISIRFMKASASTYNINERREEGCLINKEHLKKVNLIFDVDDSDEESEGREEYDEAVMKMLQPPSNLRELYVYGYHGVRMPRWPREDRLATFLPNLVQIKFYDCWNLQNLGQIRFPHLKMLYVENCPNLTGILECPALGHLGLTNFNDRLEIIDISSNFKKVKIDNLAWLDSLHFQSGANKAIKNFACLSALEVLKIIQCSNSSLSVLAVVPSRELPFCHSLRSLTLSGVSEMSAMKGLETSVLLPNLMQSAIKCYLGTHIQMF